MGRAEAEAGVLDGAGDAGDDFLGDDGGVGGGVDLAQADVAGVAAGEGVGLIEVFGEGFVAAGHAGGEAVDAVEEVELGLEDFGW